MYISCTYAIRLQKGARIQLLFQNVSLSECYPANYIKLYDGRDASSRLVVTIRGEIDGNFSSSGNELFIEFNANWYNSNDRKWHGFVLTYFEHRGNIYSFKEILN